MSPEKAMAESKSSTLSDSSGPAAAAEIAPHLLG